MFVGMIDGDGYLEISINKRKSNPVTLPDCLFVQLDPRWENGETDGT